MTYAEKLKHPLWQKKRLSILDRDKWMCQHCYSTTITLHVHHLDYIFGNEPWDYPDHYLITLCEKCHKDAEEDKKEFEKKILPLLRLKIKDSFIQNCASSVLSKYDQIDHVFYLLWELIDNESDVIDILRDLSNKKRKESFLINAKEVLIPCPSCKSNLYSVSSDYIICAKCDWEAIG